MINKVKLELNLGGRCPFGLFVCYEDGQSGGTIFGTLDFQKKLEFNQSVMNFYFSKFSMKLVVLCNYW